MIAHHFILPKFIWEYRPESTILPLDLCMSGMADLMQKIKLQNEFKDLEVICFGGKKKGSLDSTIYLVVTGGSGTLGVLSFGHNFATKIFD